MNVFLPDLFIIGPGSLLLLFFFSKLFIYGLSGFGIKYSLVSTIDGVAFIFFNYLFSIVILFLILHKYKPK